MKQILLSATLVLWAFSAGAQTSTSVNPTCQLGLNRSPSVRGIRLGMKLDDLLRLFPRAEESEHVKPALQKKDSYPNLGVFSFDISPGWYPTNEQFRGIGILRFTFIDDRLADYAVEYAYPPDSPPWPRVEVSETFLRLPLAFARPRAYNTHPFSFPLAIRPILYVH